MVAIDFSMIPVTWKDCTGFASSYVSNVIETYVPLAFSTFTTQAWSTFRSPRLKEPLFSETQHYIDRALYQLVVGKSLVCSGRLSWGLVAFYYSSFFSAQASIRLAGTMFAKVNYDQETVCPPTHRLEVVNLEQNDYRIRKAGGTGEHQRVWSTFYDAFSKISGRAEWRKYAPVTGETDPELRLIEMHRRHLVNYVPGYGYTELRSPRDAATLRTLLQRDNCTDFSRTLVDDNAQLEARSYLRLSLCLRLLQRIADQKGVYSIHHPQFTARREQWLNEFDCPAVMRPRIKECLEA